MTINPDQFLLVSKHFLAIGLVNLVRGHLQTEACTLNVTVTLLQDPPPPHPPTLSS